MIRWATVDDLDAMVRMGCRFLTETSYAAHYPANPAQLRAVAERFIEDADKLALVSEADGEMTGMLLAMVFDHPLSGERIASELAWWVNPERRGHGLRLLREMERWARSNGARLIQMIAPAGEPVGRLYEARGYSVTETHYQRALA